jgi:hypothetical protein
MRRELEANLMGGFRPDEGLRSTVMVVDVSAEDVFQLATDLRRRVGFVFG